MWQSCILLLTMHCAVSNRKTAKKYLVTGKINQVDAKSFIVLFTMRRHVSLMANLLPQTKV